MNTITIPRETFDQMQEALEALLKRDKRNTCQHKETYLGGVIWEICEGCGMKWADDRGGKPQWKNPPEWDAAEAVLSAAKAVQPQAQYSIDADPQGIRARVVSAVVGAMAYGASNTNKPPEGHWLNELWDIARVDANRVQPQAQGEVSWNLKYADSTPKLNVGHSAFEDWFQQQLFATQIGVKQMCRDAYAAGMGDPLVTYAHPKASEPALDESQVEELARSAFESAMAFGIDYKSYERLAKGVWKAMLAAAPEATK